MVMLNVQSCITGKRQSWLQTSHNALTMLSSLWEVMPYLDSIVLHLCHKPVEWYLIVQGKVFHQFICLSFMHVFSYSCRERGDCQWDSEGENRRKEECPTATQNCSHRVARPPHKTGHTGKQVSENWNEWQTILLITSLWNLTYIMTSSLLTNKQVNWAH